MTELKLLKNVINSKNQNIKINPEFIADTEIKENKFLHINLIFGKHYILEFEDREEAEEFILYLKN